MTVGGNDIGYLPSVIVASLPAYLRRCRCWVAGCAAPPRQLEPATGSPGPRAASDRFSLPSGTVPPSARIICVDYLTVLPPDYREDLPFNEPAQRALTGLVNDLNGALVRACSEHDVQLLPAADHSIAHHA